MKIALLAGSLLIPAILLVIGWLWKKYPPKQINAVYGYRTRRSMSSQAAWDFAHQHAGMIWRRWGLGLLAATMVPVVYGFSRSADWYYWMATAVVIVQVIVLLLSILPTHLALGRRFDAQGNPK